MPCLRGGGWSAKNWMELVLMQLVSREERESGWDQGWGKVRFSDAQKRLPVIDLCAEPTIPSSLTATTQHVGYAFFQLLHYTATSKMAKSGVFCHPRTLAGTDDRVLQSRTHVHLVYRR